MSTDISECRLTRCPECGEPLDPMSERCAECGAEESGDEAK